MSILLKDMSIGNVYSFSTYSPAFLGAKLTRVKLKSKCDASIARKLHPIDQTYAQVFPALPFGSHFDVEGQVYYVFEQLNGDMLVMAGQWIIEDSIEEIHHVSYTVTIPNGDEGMKDKIKQALLAVNITDFSITEH